MDNVEIPNWLKGLPLAPEFRPTDTEFADPIAYISKIEKQASEYGICKVIPPLPKPSKKYVLNNLNKSLSKSRGNSLDRVNDTESKAVFTTRQQELGQAPKKRPHALKQVWQSGEVYTLEQFESKAKAFSRATLGKIKEVTPQTIESLFWKANNEKPIYVEYANDVPGSGFGKPEGLLHYFRPRKRRRRRSYCMQENVDVLRTEELGSSPGSEPGKEGGVCSSGEVEGTAGWKLSNSPWNLQVIARSAGSLTRFMLDDIPGVTSPMVYIGMLFSWFAWHVEDHELHSLNFLHMGTPKTWYAVPGDYAFAFEELIRRQAYGGDFDNLASLKLLGEKTTLLSPEFVIASGIPCCRLVQNPGEFVVTFPRAYHVGFSHGFNCGEAANFGTPQWLTVARDAAVRRAAMDHLPMLSHQQLLYLLTMSFTTRIPKSLLTGVRSSRLRDCLKKERELLVKKAFIEDMMRQNNQLNNLLGRDFSFRAVLWHPDSLPSFIKDSFQPTGTAPDVAQSKNGELLKILNKDAGPDGLTHKNTSFMETVDDFYLDTDDISFEFQVDSGTLPCVACGILSYPFMSVVQPSKKAATEIFPAEYLSNTRETKFSEMPELYYHQYTTKSPTSATKIIEGWDTSGFLRPRIFCPEHAIQIEELMRLKGGAKMLIICHSDFQRIKASAAAIAEEVGTAFPYKEVLLDSASKEELNLIDLAIDSEQPADCEEDWTSKLGLNLRFTVKSRTTCPPKKIEHALNLKYLLSVIAPGSVISTIKWCSRKPRTKRDSNCGKRLKLDDDNHSTMDEIICEQGGRMVIKEKVLLQYSRRKYSIKPEHCSGAKCVSGCSMQFSSKVTDGNCGKIDASEAESSGAICLKKMESDLEELCTSSLPKRWVEPHDEVEMTERDRKHAGDSISADLVDSLPFDALVPLSLRVETSVSALVDPNFPEKTTADKNADNTSEDLSTGKCCIPTDNDILIMEKSTIIGDNDMRDGNDGIAVTSDLMKISSPRETCNKQDGRDLGTSSISSDGTSRISSDACCTTSDAEVTDILVQDKACVELNSYEDATSRISELHCVNETRQHECRSTCTKSTTSLDVDISQSASTKQKLQFSCQPDVQGCPLLLKEEQDKGKTIADRKMTSRNSRKRAREVVQQTGVHINFVRSPCEGLRPRNKKVDPTSRTICNVITATEQEKLSANKSKKASGHSISHCGEVMDGNRIYKCEMDGCLIYFKTKAELSLHKRNRCHHKECGKKFRSHRYVALHQRVHDDERPLKCTWKGCDMTFKWVWARTEHMRLHTGERPYKCEIKGCGLTFRFVSDFSRHRRKTGHYVISST